MRIVVLASIVSSLIACASAGGEASDGDLTSSQVRAQVAAEKIAIGKEHSCAITAAGGVKCWGSNEFAQLGNGEMGSNLKSEVPVDVVGLSSGVVSIVAAGDHTCAILQDGGVKCWGSGNFGETGELRISTTPASVSGLEGPVVSASAGAIHTCLILRGGALKCFGDFGAGDATANPTDVEGLKSGVVAVSGGIRFGCALTSAGGVKCWGDNSVGQLGNGSRTSSTSAVAVDGLTSGVVSIASGSFHTCAALKSGAVKCWGMNYTGELGDGTTNEVALSPVPVKNLKGAILVTASEHNTCAMIDGGRSSCWGSNKYGQLGLVDATYPERADQSNIPVQVPLNDLVTIKPGHQTCARNENSELMCWGYNNKGQVGRDDVHAEHPRVLVPFIVNID